jgi:alkylated DNA repair protein alkB family protein 1
MRDPASTSSAGITALALQLSSDCGNVQLAPGSVTALLFSAHPGLVVFPAAVPPQQQLQLMRAALTEWPGPPARTNHSAAYGDSIPAGLFDAAQAGLRLLTHQPTTPPGCAAGGMRQQQEEQEQQQHVGGGTEQQDPYQQHTPQQRQTGAASGQPRTWAAGGSGPLAASLLRKLRWVCLGPPYDWTQRRYEPQLPHRPLAPLLAAMARSFAAAAATALQRPAAAAGAPSQQPGAGREQQPACACCHSSSRAAPFTPDAALVNYYHAGDTLNGHKDDVEVDLSQPIVTHSLGCDAVFLMGGPTR